MAIIQLKSRPSDGTIRKVNPDYNVAQALSSGGSVSDQSATLRIDDRLRFGNYEQSHALMNFPTIQLGPNAVVNSAILRAEVTGVFDEPAFLTARSKNFGASLLASDGVDNYALSSLPSVASGAPYAAGTFNFTGNIPVNIMSDTGILVHYDSQASGTIPTHGSRSISLQSGNGSIPPVLVVDFTAPAPVITSVVPSKGLAGNTIEINGENFASTSNVTVNGVPVSVFEVTAWNKITAIVPNTTTGVIGVTTDFGSATSPDPFVFLQPPTITDVTPLTGGQGTVIEITGTFLDDGTVTVGGVDATVNSINPEGTKIFATVGEGDNGDVVVTTPLGFASFSSFDFIPPPPTVTSVSPVSGGISTTVAVFGSNFDPNGTSVTFGGVAAASVSFVNSGRVNCTLGGATPLGVLDVAVTTSAGTDSLLGAYELFPTPNITDFNPKFGVAGDTVVIDGTNFTDITSVTFNGSPAQSFVIDSDIQITAVIGSGTFGQSGSVAVSSPGGLSSMGGFTFREDPPTITSFTPSTAPEGSSVTIKGTNFLSAISVSFGATQAAAFTVVDSETISAEVGNGSTGKITVTTATAPAAESATDFTFNPSPIQPVSFAGLSAVDPEDKPRDGFPKLPVRTSVISSPERGTLSEEKDGFPPLSVRIG